MADYVFLLTDSLLQFTFLDIHCFHVYPMRLNWDTGVLVKTLSPKHMWERTRASSEVKGGQKKFLPVGSSFRGHNRSDSTFQADTNK